MTTVSSINIDIPLQPKDDVVINQVQRLPSVEPRKEPGSRTIHKESKARGKPDLSPSSPVNPTLTAVSGVCASGGDKMTASNGLLQSNPEGTFPVSMEKKESDVDIKDDTGELLREADLLGSNAKNVQMDANVNEENKNDTVTLIKRAPAHLRTPDVDVSFERK